MAKRSTNKQGQHGEAQFPYTTRPNSLRRLLKLIPDRPKPAQLTRAILSGWELRGGEDSTTLRVLKVVGLLDANSAPSPLYDKFMDPQQGPPLLASQVKRVYARFFEQYHLPHKETAETIRRLFHTHSGGAPTVMEFQISTFKVLCEFCDFEHTALETKKELPLTTGVETETRRNNGAGLTVHIDLHIHLPENKSARDYQAIFEDIGKYIYGREYDNKPT